MVRSLHAVIMGMSWQYWAFELVILRGKNDCTTYNLNRQKQEFGHFTFLRFNVLHY